MAEYLTDEEQLQTLKNWWKANGSALLIGIAVVASAYFGWHWWARYQQQYAQQASTLYSELSEALIVSPEKTLSDDVRTTAEFLITQLQTDYKRSLYAVNASFHGAKIAVDKGDLPRAVTQLQWVLDQGDEPTKKLARLRLARVYSALQQYENALQYAAYTEKDNFGPLFAEVRGDVLLAQGDSLAAKAAYEYAIDSLPVSGGLQRLLLNVKLSNVANGATL